LLAESFTLIFVNSFGKAIPICVDLFCHHITNRFGSNLSRPEKESRAPPLELGQVCNIKTIIIKGLRCCAYARANRAAAQDIGHVFPETQRAAYIAAFNNIVLASR
jgi:hypothetical protein